MSLPLARAIVLTDAGTAVYTEALAAYDGTTRPATVDNTDVSSSLDVADVRGAAAAFDLLDALLASARSATIANAAALAALEN